VPMPSNPSRPTGLIPHLIVRGGVDAIDFYRRAFGAELVFDLTTPEGKLAHAEMTLGANRFMLADEYPDLNCVSPLGRGGTSVSLAVYVDDVDSLASRAVSAGAQLERPIADEFYGDRVAHLEDPFGHRWTLHTRIEEVTLDEMRRRMAGLGGEGAAPSEASGGE
jgi:PhnB protein